MSITEQLGAIICIPQRNNQTFPKNGDQLFF